MGIFFTWVYICVFLGYYMLNLEPWMRANASSECYIVHLSSQSTFRKQTKSDEKWNYKPHACDRKSLC